MKHEKNSRGALSEFGQVLHDVIQQLVDFPEDVEVRGYPKRYSHID